MKNSLKIENVFQINVNFRQKSSSKIFLYNVCMGETASVLEAMENARDRASGANWFTLLSKLLLSGKLLFLCNVTVC